MNGQRRGLDLAVLAISLVPLAALSMLVAKYAVNVPMYDQWLLVPYMEALNPGHSLAPNLDRLSVERSLSLGDLAAQQNEHRILVPLLVMLALAALTDWNTVAEVALTLVFATGSFFLLRDLIGRSFPTNAAAAAVLTVLAAVLVFSPIQWENWLFGIQVGWMFTITGMLATIRVLGGGQERPLAWPRLTAAALLAALTTYSFATGIWVWPAGLIVLLSRSRMPWQIVAWIVSAVAILGVYFYGYDSSPGPGPSTTLLPFDDIGGFAGYVGAYLGSPFTDDSGLAIGIGFALTIGLALASAYVLQRDRARLSLLAPWLALGAIACAAAAATSSRRLSHGVDQALASRYTSIALLLAIASAVVVTMAVGLALEHRQALRRLLAVAASVVAVSVLLAGWSRGETSMSARHDDMIAQRDCLHRAASPSDPCIGEAFPIPDTERARGVARDLWFGADYLRRIGWAGF